jgi:drug/metabolite transporter (DMT)-like permease
LALAGLVLIVLIWGSTWAVIRVGLIGVPPLTGLAIRFGLAGIVLFLIGLARGVRFGRVKNERWLWLSTASLTFTLCYIVVYWGEQFVPSGLAAVLWATFPFFVALITRWLIPSEPIRPATLAGMLVSFVGLLLIYSEDVELLGGPKVLFAAIVFLLSPLASAIGNVTVKRWGQGSHPIATTAVPMMMTGAFVGVLAFLLERDRPMNFDAVAIGAIVYLALFGTALAFGVYYWLLNQLPATRLALTASITPVVALVIGTTIMAEPITPRVMAGAAVVLAGVYLAVGTGRLRRGDETGERGR